MDMTPPTMGPPQDKYGNQFRQYAPLSHPYARSSLIHEPLVRSMTLRSRNGTNLRLPSSKVFEPQTAPLDYESPQVESLSYPGYASSSRRGWSDQSRNETSIPAARDEHVNRVNRTNCFQVQAEIDRIDPFSDSDHLRSCHVNEEDREIVRTVPEIPTFIMHAALEETSPKIHDCVPVAAVSRSKIASSESIQSPASTAHNPLINRYENCKSSIVELEQSHLSPLLPGTEAAGKRYDHPHESGKLSQNQSPRMNLLQAETCSFGMNETKEFAGPQIQGVSQGAIDSSPNSIPMHAQEPKTYQNIPEVSALHFDARQASQVVLDGQNAMHVIKRTGNQQPLPDPQDVDMTEETDAFLNYDWKVLSFQERRKRRRRILEAKRLALKEMLRSSKIDQVIAFKKVPDRTIIELSRTYQRQLTDPRGWRKLRNRMNAQNIRDQRRKTLESHMKENETLLHDLSSSENHCSALKLELKIQKDRTQAIEVEAAGLRYQNMLLREQVARLQRTLSHGFSLNDIER